MKKVDKEFAEGFIDVFQKELKKIVGDITSNADLAAISSKKFEGDLKTNLEAAKE